MVSSVSTDTFTHDGVLAGTGAAMVRAWMYTDTVPTKAPAALDGLVTPRLDRDGHVVDWHLAPSSPGEGVSDADFAAFRAWRSGYVTERFLAERALIRQLLNWAAHRLDLSALTVLLTDHGRVDESQAFTMRQQVADAREALTHSNATGFGVFTRSEQRSPSRAFIPTAPATVLLSCDQTSASVSTVGLMLTTASGTVNTLVKGWWQDQTGTTIQTGDGPPRRASGTEQRLLQQLGRHAPNVQIIETPMAVLLAPLFVFLSDSASLAADTHADLHVGLG